jgi:hypothetical protein
MTARSDVIFITDKTKLLKSALGQNEKNSIEQMSSGSPLKADIVRYSRHVSNVPPTDLIDIFHSATRFGGNDFEIVEFCLCHGSEHPNDGPRVAKPMRSSES